MIPYARHSIDKNEVRSVIQVLRSPYLSQGPKIQEFETAFQKTTGASYAIAVSSGTAALHLACLVAGFGSRDEVIVPALTFLATANAVRFVGARPIFADIDPETGNVTVETIGRVLTKRTRGIIVVHYAGQPVDLAQIQKLSRDHGCILIEDAAHALGATYKGSRIGDCRYSELCAFSFHPAKGITTGEGGMLTTRKASYAKKVRDLRNHGMIRDSRRFKHPELNNYAYYEMHELGFNYRMTELQAAIGIEQLKKLPRFQERREKIANAYQKAFSFIPELRLLKRKYGRSAWHLFVMRVRPVSTLSRDAFVKKLQERRIFPSLHYLPLPMQPYYRLPSRSRCDYAKARTFWAEAISIPIYPGLTKGEVKYVIRTIKEVVLKSRPRIETAYLWKNGRIGFRPVTLSSLTKDYLDWVNDPRVNRFLSCREYDFDSLVHYFEEMRRDPSRNLFLEIWDHRRSRHIGNVTLTNIEKRRGTLGIMIGDSRYRSKGWGKSATRAICEYSFKKFGLHRIKLGTHVRNTRAIRCFQGVGFRVRKKFLNRGLNVPAYEMELSRTELEGIQQ